MFGRIWMVPALIGCESGLSATVEIEVDPGVAASFDREAPGILVTDVGLEPSSVIALCGQAPDEITFTEDFGFGCLEDGKRGTTETLSAWVQPMPEGWDAEGLCTLEPSGFGGIIPTPEIMGEGTSSASTDTAAPGDWLAPEPDPIWAQGRAVAEWHKVPICGGSLRGDPVVVKWP